MAEKILHFDMESVFGKDGLLSMFLSSYEYRPEQVEMANKIRDILENRKKLVCEAGTGVGKSLAYLVPAVMWLTHPDKVLGRSVGGQCRMPPACKEMDENVSGSTEGGGPARVIVSTYTKTLQHQLLTHDIPIVQSVLDGLGIKFNIAPAFGSENYLCVRRWHRLADKGSLFGDKEIERIAEWEANTETGLRSELERDGRVSIFSQVARDPDLCIGKKCSFRPYCYYERARRKLFKAELIVTNHWLFFANIASGKRVLPPYHGVVFDEAQNLEHVATEYFGIHISNYRISLLLNLIKRGVRFQNLDETIAELQSVKDDFFRKISTMIGSEVVVRIKEKGIVQNSLSPYFNNLSLLLKKSRKSAQDDETAEEISGYISKCNELDLELSFFLNQLNSDSVYWVEQRRNSNPPFISLNTAPVLIAPYMEKYVFSADGESGSPIILTSATMTVDNSFKFMTERLGLKDKEELLLSSSFNYKKNAILYVPKEGPDPRLEAKYEEFLVSELSRILSITHGRALVLFTSYKLMDKVYELLIKKKGQRHPAPSPKLWSVGDLFPLKQGDASRDELLDRFRQKPSVLFGVASFWQGIDIPGEALIAIIITRLPFEVPDSPITEARIEWMSEHGGNPFWDYQLPQAVMALKQGFGRLIRKNTDYGLVAILDTRVKKMAYGKKFLSSLPECKFTHNIDEVKHFFDRFRK